MQVPMTILNANTKRETGKKAQLGNIAAAKVGMNLSVWVLATLLDDHADLVVSLILVC